MTSHNPAGYYGLQLPQNFETEILQLGYFELVETVHEMIYSITPNGETFPSFEHLFPESESYYHDLSFEPRISLIRWIAEILSTKFNAQS
ncbi:MAG: hypothetical protein IM516_01330 [Pseudanabaena sp. M158S2SP1A06QC]|jgi:hypothetical protein|nr:hypothetical protein [Pseudanabaena sp. M158S2SP1A06QC]MCA6624357.1 hypothetical protein [Pseudanabaena sp. M165S2SP1A06QC]